MNDDFDSLSLFKNYYDYNMVEHTDQMKEMQSIKEVLDVFSSPLQSINDQNSDFEFICRQNSQNSSSSVHISLNSLCCDDIFNVDKQSSSNKEFLECFNAKNDFELNLESSISNQESIKRKQLFKNEVQTDGNILSSMDSLKQTHFTLKECMHDESKVKSCLNRKDVVIKRSMRNYYCDLIQDNTSYRRKMRNIKLKHKMLIMYSKQLSESLFSAQLNECTSFFLAALAFPSDMKKILRQSLKIKKNSKDHISKALELIGVIEGVMKNFSTKSLVNFLQINEISCLLLNYLAKVCVFYYLRIKQSFSNFYNILSYPPKVKNPEYEIFYQKLETMANEHRSMNPSNPFLSTLIYA